MSRLICAICIALVTLPAFCEPAAKYEVATIMDVKPHQSSADSPSGVARYDISVKVGHSLCGPVHGFLGYEHGEVCRRTRTAGPRRKENSHLQRHLRSAV